jgi:hypothetical protein
MREGFFVLRILSSQARLRESNSICTKKQGHGDQYAEPLFHFSF